MTFETVKITGFFFVFLVKVSEVSLSYTSSEPGATLASKSLRKSSHENNSRVLHLFPLDCILYQSSHDFVRAALKSLDRLVFSFGKRGKLLAFI